jgi:hypothetical protein
MAGPVQIEKVQGALQTPRWSVVHLAAFRFCFVYLGLYCLGTQILSGLWGPGTLPPIRQIVFWTATHVFGIKSPLVYMGSGSGDKTFDWVFSFCLLVFAALVTGIWSVLDRKRANYVTLHKWFRLFIRFSLAGQMILYGLLKVIPVQMTFPALTTLIQPYGQFSPMGVLWSSIGASPAYETFVGFAETLGGILLMAPRTAMLGALVCLADLIDVFVLNMTYDVPVKLFSFHLILMALFLLAPEVSRLGQFFFLNRATPPSKQPQLFQTRRANPIALAAQIFFGIYLVGMNIYGGLRSWREYGGGRVKPPLYGIWNIEEISMGRQIQLPLLTDQDRWRRVIFDVPSWMMVQLMNDSVTGYRPSIDMKAKTLTLTRVKDQKQKPKFTFQQVGQEQLIFDGSMDGHACHMRLKLMDRDKFVLVKRRFQWIQEY